MIFQKILTKCFLLRQPCNHLDLSLLEDMYIQEWYFAIKILHSLVFLLTLKIQKVHSSLKSCRANDVNFMISEYIDVFKGTTDAQQG